MKNKAFKILIRADSSQTIGLGHVMRSLVLAQRLKKQNYHVEITFASQDLQGNINHKIQKKNFHLHRLKSDKITELIRVVLDESIDLLIIDSYTISSKDEKKLLQRVPCKVLSFDDTFEKRYAHMVLNHGIQVKKSDYKSLVKKGTTVFAGSRYTILRDEFFKSFATTTSSKTVAILLGGNDTKNLSLQLTKQLKMLDKKFQISIITSSVNPHLKELQKGTDFSLLVDIENIAEVLAQQSFVICASGGTLFEVMALKQRFINIQVADNQKNIIDFLQDKGIETSLHINELNQKNLKEKIEYIFHHDIYKNLHLNFSKNYLAKKILKELQ